MAAIQGNLPRPSSLPLEEAPMAPLPRNSTTTAARCNGDSSSDKIPDSIDSALLAALRDPRERLGLLKLEKVMVDFYSNSNDQYIDIGGPFNSVVVSPSTGLNGSAPPTRPQTTFQRCILHRLADRFRMTRETNNPYIRLWKQADSCLPPRLLVDLDSSEYEEEQTPMTTTSMPILNNPPKNMKMKIMKRSSSSGISTSSDTSRNHRKKNSSSTNLSDKEKAYAEARARIFSDEDGGGDDQSSSAAAAAADTTNNLPAAAVNLPTTSSSSSLPSSSEEDASAATAAASNTNNSTTNTRPSKATWRNRRQEENDPDFQRGVILQPTYNDYYSQAAAAATAPAWGAQAPQDAYYNNAPYQGRGGRGRGGGRYQNNNYYNNNNYGYRRSNSGEAATNVHSLEEFPTLR